MARLAALAAGILLCAPGVSGSLAAGVPETRAERSRQEAALSELRERVESLRRELAESGDKKADAADALRESERAISDAGRALNDLATRQTALQQQLQGRRAELSALAREQASHREALARLLVEQHRRRQQEPLQMLLLGGGPYEVRRQLVYLRALNAARVASIADAQRRATRAAALRAETEIRLAELQQVVQAASEQRAVLERERQTHQRTLARIAAQLDLRRRQLATAQSDESRLAQLVARLNALLEARARAARPRSHEAPGSAGNAGQVARDVAAALGRFKGLLKIPAAGELIARFGVPRDGSGPAWKGWFIRTPAGTPVQAVASGRIVFADWLRGFGNLVIVDHGDGFMSLYGNNDALLQQVGTAIEAGQTVAQAGTSGGAAESGVYFELRHNGIAFDPKDWFAAH